MKNSTVPIEERKLKDFYPDLQLNQPLTIVNVQDSLELIHQFYIQDPLPKIQLIMTKALPTTSFKVLEHTAKRIDPLPPFYRHLEPTEEELFQRVEYDMDEQDRQWLVEFNERLSKHGKECSMDYFEMIMDRLEKEWFELVKDIPRPISHFPEDITCAVCDDGEAENSNAIVFCDGCNLAVHQDCYGVPFIPEGQWLCRRCMISPGLGVQCVLCPVSDGAFKQTNTNKWAHLTCAMWIPECHVQNTVYMEPIEGIEAIPKSRWKLTCYICHKRYGAPIQCSTKNCFTAFHPTCGKKAKLFMQMRGQGQSQDFKAHCDRHTPKEHRDTVDVDGYLKTAIEELTKTSISKPTKSRKRKGHHEQEQRLYYSRKKVSLSTPIIPQYVLSKVMNEKQKNDQVIIAIAKYWSLKKESLRGAALLKRLHLEPWTASISASKEEDEVKTQKFQTLAFIRKDLEQVRLMLDVVRKREKVKTRFVRIQNEILEYCLFPMTKVLKPVLDRCIKFDKLGIFGRPVNAEEVPDYYTIIKNPMDFETMTQKLERKEYSTIKQFQNDILLICENCRLYNRPETIYAKTAVRLQFYFETLVPVLKAQVEQSGLDFETGGWKDGIPKNLIESFDSFSFTPSSNTISE